MVFLLSGPDILAKDEKIKEIKSQYLGMPEAISFDYEVLHGHKLSPEDLKKGLISLPLFSPHRVVLLRQTHKLSLLNKKIILDFIDDPQDKTVLILDTEDSGQKNSFMRQIASAAKVFSFDEARKNNVFDMTRVMSSGRLAEALKILFDLMADGTHPLQILGGLVWFWGKQGGRLPGPRYKKGLLALQEADLNIKRSRMKPEYAIEFLVVRLTDLMG